MTAAVATFVVIPVKSRLDLTRRLVDHLTGEGGYETLFVLDNGSPRRHRRLAAPPARLRQDRARWTPPDSASDGMWNLGVRLARTRHPGPTSPSSTTTSGPDQEFWPASPPGSAAGPDLWVVSPNYDRRAVRGVEYVRSTSRGGWPGSPSWPGARSSTEISFDEGFRWWYGDDDSSPRWRPSADGQGIVGDATVEHIGGGAQSVRYTPAGWPTSSGTAVACGPSGGTSYPPPVNNPRG